MRALKRALLSFVIAVLAVVVLAAPAFADNYTYTVRIFPGNNGSLAGASEDGVLVLGPYEYGELVRLPGTDVVNVSDGKYYARGYRESGQDALASTSFNITEDRDYVVAYGVRGNMVTARINFVEYGTGNPLTADNGQTYMEFEGKPGDTFMVPYEYVSGYRPRYLNVTGTLQESGNEWTLEYIPLAEGETIVTTVTTPAAPAATGTTEGGTEVIGGTTGTEGTTATPEAPATEEILNVDTPLAGPDGTGNNGGSKPNGGGGTSIGGNPTPLTNLLASTAGKIVLFLRVLLLCLLIFLLLRRRKDEEE